MMVSIEHNVKFDDDYILVSPNPSLNNPAPTEPESGLDAPSTRSSPASQPDVPVSNTTIAEGRGARVKQPSQYVQHICTGEGTATGDDSKLPCSMQNASIAEVPEITEMASDYAMLASILAGTEPHNECKAHSSPGWPHWHQAMQKEISELIHKWTWDIVDAPPDTNVVGSWWTYCLKREIHGAITCYKAHLVAQGFMQTHGIDYNDTFAPITKFMSTCIILALVAIHDWEVHQVDIKNM